VILTGRYSSRRGKGRQRNRGQLRRGQSFSRRLQKRKGGEGIEGLFPYSHPNMGDDRRDREKKKDERMLLEALRLAKGERESAVQKSAAFNSERSFLP